MSVGAVLALYLNVFVAVVQAFQKLAFLQPFAPTQSEPPFIVAQALVLGKSRLHAAFPSRVRSRAVSVGPR